MVWFRGVAKVELQFTLWVSNSIPYGPVLNLLLYVHTKSEANILQTYSREYTSLIAQTSRILQEEGLSCERQRFFSLIHS